MKDLAWGYIITSNANMNQRYQRIVKTLMLASLTWPRTEFGLQCGMSRDWYDTCISRSGTLCMLGVQHVVPFVVFDGDRSLSL